MRKVLIYTDGSCDKNPGGTGGYSAIIFNKTPDPIFLAGSDTNTTNQRMEMRAVIEALRYIIVPSNIVLYTDSAYVSNCINEQWYETWNKNGWKNSKSEPVANQDLWEDMINIIHYHKSVVINKVKGHSDNVFNNECDELAKSIVTFKKHISNMMTDKL